MPCDTWLLIWPMPCDSSCEHAAAVLLMGLLRPLCALPLSAALLRPSLPPKSLDAGAGELAPGAPVPLPLPLPLMVLPRRMTAATDAHMTELRDAGLLSHAHRAVRSAFFASAVVPVRAGGVAVGIFVRSIQRFFVTARTGARNDLATRRSDRIM